MLEERDDFPKDNAFSYAWYALLETWRDLKVLWRRLKWFYGGS